ncbi:MAG TPA: hypothetical protein VLB32_05980 [Candidatus Acidoferrales bacterium]|nr:hypothetical protein [Candidatus Acidoferrales bacterium]
MRISARLAALAVVAVLLAQPLLANAACKSPSADKDCPPVCPMGEEHRSSALVQRQTNDLSCCQISPTGRAPASPGAKDRESPSSTSPGPSAPAKLQARSEAHSPAVPFSIPHASHSPLHTLYCVFLI